MRPLEQGSYEGRSLTGEPHRASWVIASPLNVFVVPSQGYWRRVVLAARLRHTGEINVVRVGPDPQQASDVLEKVIAIQRESEVALRLVPVARTSHQVFQESGERIDRRQSLQACAPEHRSAHLVSAADFSHGTGQELQAAGPVRLARIAQRQRRCRARRRAAHGAPGQHRVAEPRLRGPAAMPAWEVKRRVLADPLLASYMQDYALKNGMTEDAVMDEAHGYIDEISFRLSRRRGAVVRQGGGLHVRSLLERGRGRPRGYQVPL